MVKPGVSFSTTKHAYARRLTLGLLHACQQRDPEGHVRPGVGDERLSTVDEPAVVTPCGAGPDTACVGSGIGLGEPERAEDAPLGEWSQPTLSLCVVPEEVQRQRTDRRVRLPRRGHGLVGQADLLHCCDEADRRHADPAPLLRDEDAEKSELTHLAEQVGRAPRLFPGQWRADGDLLLCEVATELDEISFRLVQREVHRSPYEAAGFAPLDGRWAKKVADQSVRSAGT